MCLVMNDKRKSYSKEDKLSLLRDYYQPELSTYAREHRLIAPVFSSIHAHIGGH